MKERWRNGGKKMREGGKEAEEGERGVLWQQQQQHITPLRLVIQGASDRTEATRHLSLYLSPTGDKADSPRHL